MTRRKWHCPCCGRTKQQWKYQYRRAKQAKRSVFVDCYVCLSGGMRKGCAMTTPDWPKLWEREPALRPTFYGIPIEPVPMALFDACEAILNGRELFKSGRE